MENMFFKFFPFLRYKVICINIKIIAKCVARHETRGPLDQFACFLYIFNIFINLFFGSVLDVMNDDKVASGQL